MSLLLIYFMCVLVTQSWLFVTPWTVACQAPLSVGFSRQEYSSGLPVPSPRDLPDPGISCTASRFFTFWATRAALYFIHTPNLPLSPSVTTGLFSIFVNLFLFCICIHLYYFSFFYLYFLKQQKQQISKNIGNKNERKICNLTTQYIISCHLIVSYYFFMCIISSYKCFYYPPTWRWKSKGSEKSWQAFSLFLHRSNL